MSRPHAEVRQARTVLVVDWPSPDVPDTLARAGYTVVVKSGPGPDDFTRRQVRDDEVVPVPLGRRPERVDLVYVHRPPDELPHIVELAKALGATTVWYQSGLAGPGAKDPRGCWIDPQTSRTARELVESAGLAYVDDQYIADVVRLLG